MSSATLLIVEDEPRIVSFLEEGLHAEGFATLAALDGETGVRRASEPDVAAVILDIGLPKMDGFAVLAAIRRTRPELPVLMLTARGDLPSRVGGLDAGADDYLTKPFAFEELLARVRGLLRRAQAAVLIAGGLRLDLRGRTVDAGRRSVELTSRECALLEHLMRRPNAIVPRAELLRAVWQFEFDPGSTVLETTMTRLRHKLYRAGAATALENVRGEGYRFLA